MQTWQKFFIALSGILMIVVGIIALVNPAATLVSLAVIIGVFTLISGITTIIYYFSGAKAMYGSGWILFEGLLSLLLGILFLCNEILVADVLPIVFAMWVLFSGITKIISASDIKKFGAKHWWVVLISGIVSTLVGICALVAPIVGVIAITVFVGIGFIMDGIGCFCALAGRPDR